MALTDCRDVCHHDSSDRVGYSLITQIQLAVQTEQLGLLSSPQVDISQNKVDTILFEFTNTDGGFQIFRGLHFGSEII